MQTTTRPVMAIVTVKNCLDWAISREAGSLCRNLQRLERKLVGTERSRSTRAATTRHDIVSSARKRVAVHHRTAGALRAAVKTKDEEQCATGTTFPKGKGQGVRWRSSHCSGDRVLRKWFCGRACPVGRLTRFANASNRILSHQFNLGEFGEHQRQTLSMLAIPSQVANVAPIGVRVAKGVTTRGCGNNNTPTSAQHRSNGEEIVWTAVKIWPERQAIVINRRSTNRSTYKRYSGGMYLAALAA